MIPFGKRLAWVNQQQQSVTNEVMIVNIPPETFKNVLIAMQNKQVPWHCVQHFSFGIIARNLIREAGFDWDDGFLDDHWYELVEEAALRFSQRPQA